MQTIRIITVLASLTSCVLSIISKDYSEAMAWSGIALLTIVNIIEEL